MSLVQLLNTFSEEWLAELSDKGQLDHLLEEDDGNFDFAFANRELQVVEEEGF